MSSVSCCTICSSISLFPSRLIPHHPTSSHLSHHSYIFISLGFRLRPHSRPIRSAYPMLPSRTRRCVRDSSAQRHRPARSARSVWWQMWLGMRRIQFFRWQVRANRRPAGRRRLPNKNVASRCAVPLHTNKNFYY